MGERRENLRTMVHPGTGLEVVRTYIHVQVLNTCSYTWCLLSQKVSLHLVSATLAQNSKSVSAQCHAVDFPYDIKPCSIMVNSAPYSLWALRA